MDDPDCTMTPGSGMAELSCGFGGTCSLSCNETMTCPDGMMCMMFGGGGGMGFCMY